MYGPVFWDNRSKFPCFEKIIYHVLSAIQQLRSSRDVQVILAGAARISSRR